MKLYSHPLLTFTNAAFFVEDRVVFVQLVDGGGWQMSTIKDNLKKQLVSFMPKDSKSFVYVQMHGYAKLS